MICLNCGEHLVRDKFCTKRCKHEYRDKMNLSNARLAVLALLAYRGDWVAMQNVSAESLADQRQPLVERRGVNKFRITEQGRMRFRQWVREQLE